MNRRKRIRAARAPAWLACLAVLIFNGAVSAQTVSDGDAVDNIVVILDASGSMAEQMPGSNERKMEVAKEALLKVMEHVKPQTHVGLLVFSGNNKRNDWVYPLGPLDKDAFASGLKRLGPDGGTPLGEYIRKGADRLLQKRAEQHGYGTYRLLIVTDGQASDGQKVNRFTPDALSRGIVIDVIGVAMDGDHTLTTRVHNYRRANDASGLERAILESVAEIGSTGDGAATDDDSFSLIADLPDGVAEGLLTALTTASNDPITGTNAWTRPVNNSAAHAPSSTSTSSHQSGSQSKRGIGRYVVWGFILLIVLKVFQSVAKKAKS